MESFARSPRVLRLLDSVGVCLSMGCAIHCMLVPLFFTVLPFLGLGVFVDARFEAVMMTLTLIVATFSLCWGTKLHRRYQLFSFLAAAVALFIAAHEVAPELHFPLVGVGGLSIAAAHILNRRLCNSCRDCVERAEA